MRRRMKKKKNESRMELGELRIYGLEIRGKNRSHFGVRMGSKPSFPYPLCFRLFVNSVFATRAAAHD